MSKQEPITEVKQEAPKTPKKAYFKGGANYAAPNNRVPYGGVRSEGIVEIIDEKPNAKHPYRVKPLRGTTAEGWVDKDSILIK